MANAPSPTQVLPSIQEAALTVSDWTTNFHLVLVAIDPYSRESSWILNTAERILKTFSQADCRVGWLVAGSQKEAEAFLGPLADEFLTFLDPDKTLISDMQLEYLPALLHINHTPELIGEAQGWDPSQWRQVISSLAKIVGWKSPIIPMPGDPVAFKGSPAIA